VYFPQRRVALEVQAAVPRGALDGIVVVEEGEEDGFVSVAVGRVAEVLLDRGPFGNKVCPRVSDRARCTRAPGRHR